MQSQNGNGARSWFRPENLKTKETGIAAAVIALLTAVVTNLDRIEEIYDRVVHPVPGLSGSWLGVFREYNANEGRWVVSSENVTISEAREHFTGVLSTPRPPASAHPMTGDYKGEFLIIEYRADNPSRNGAVVYVLQGVPATGTFIGMWTGYDPEQRVLMSCPYVLTRVSDPKQLPPEPQSWLQRACFSRGVTPPS